MAGLAAWLRFALRVVLKPLFRDIRWSGQTLLLSAENDHDEKGEALADEFSDTIAA